MPLAKIQWTGKHSGWALWKITESEAELRSLAHPEECPNDIQSSSKKLEWLAGRALLKLVLNKSGLTYTGLRKDVYGKPTLEGLSNPISLSHSYPYVALQIHEHLQVGIDVEQPKAKLLRVAKRVLSTTEQQDAGIDLIKTCVYWCAKEALYKIYGKRGLTFSKHLLINPFELQSHGELSGKISADDSDALIKLEYSIDEDYVLVYTKGE